MTAEQLMEAFIGQSRPKQRALELMLLPPDFWDNDTITDSDMKEMERFLDAVAFRAVMLSVYLGLRGGNGCGDHGHEDALEAGRKIEKDARQIMGYFT